jgi:hypothetical protein
MSILDRRNMKADEGGNFDMINRILERQGAFPSDNPLNLVNPVKISPAFSPV